MFTAQKIWYNEKGQKQVSAVQLHSADSAFQMAQHVWRQRKEAYAVTFDTFEDGSFVTRVMSKERMLFKIEYNNN